ncbi:hypothetical protein Q1695_006175 [Nippostrongylus brasiliensis]|nr:hypothetical protein Q1695_006175 [Nippostrongylus brasiliensis]
MNPKLLRKAAFSSEVDEVSVKGPKKSDGSEFRKGPGGWTQSFIYLLTVWICGALFSALIMYILLLQLQDKPHYFGKGSHIGGIPSVVYEPNPNRFDVSTKGVISFSSREPKSYLNYMVRYKKLLKGEMHHVSLYLQEYNKTESPNCTVVGGAPDGAPTNQSCRMEADSSEIFGECALTIENINKGMGFGEGEPCIMLRLTRMLGWYPEDAESQGEPCSEGEHCCGTMSFSCESKQGSAVTRMLPASGMSTCAYPFWNQPGYEQPFVMMKVSNLMTDMNEIRCKPEQASIQHFDDGEENVARIFIEKLD